MIKLGWALIQYDWCPLKMKESGHRDKHIQREDNVNTQTIYKPRKAWGYQKLGRGME